MTVQPDVKVESEVAAGHPADIARQERLRKQKEKQVCTSSTTLALTILCLYSL